MILNDRIELRVNRAQKERFIAESRRANSSYQVLLREFISAFINDDLRIKNRKVKEIYSDN